MTPAYAALIAPARPRAQLWRVVLGLALVALVYFLWMAGMAAVFWLSSGLETFERQLRRISTGSDPWSLILLLSTFAGAWAGLWVVMHGLHRRRLRSLFGRAPVVLRDFVAGVVIMAVVGGGLTLASAPLLPPLVITADPGLWLRFLPLALMGILVQTGAEELVFRGYVQSHLAARFRAQWVSMVVPSLLFGLAHYDPAELGANLWIVVASTAMFGFYASDLTARTGSLGLGWGLHFANNVLAMLIVSVMGGLDGLALFHLPTGAAPAALLRPLLLADMALMAAVWGACRLWLRRR